MKIRITIALFFVLATTAKAGLCPRFIVNWGIGGIEWLVTQRYPRKLEGYNEILENGTEQVVFVVSHPGWGIDPFLTYSALYRDFAPKFWIDEKQLRHPIFGRMIALTGAALPVPEDRKQAQIIRSTVRASQETLLAKGNVLVFASGQASRDGSDELEGTGAIGLILRKCPNARVVLVRIRGLYGSVFTWGFEEAQAQARGLGPPDPTLRVDPTDRVVNEVVWAAPRLVGNWWNRIEPRELTFTFSEPENFPKQGSHQEINAAISAFLNEGAPEPATFVPSVQYPAVQVETSAP